MRSRWYIAALIAIALIAACGVAVLAARPAPDHAWFAEGKPGPLVIAHRGGAGLRPENTLSAFLHAAAIGADVLEMDVQATADGAIVCMHDTTVDRTTNGRGRVDRLTLEEVRKLDAGYAWSGDGGFPFRGKGVRVPTLDEVLAALPESRMMIEMKNPGPGLARSLCSLLRRYGHPQRRLVASMNEAAVAAFRDACPEIATAMTAGEGRTFYYLYLLRLERAYGPPVRALVVPDRLRGETLPTRELIDAARRRNLSVHVWTINAEDRMRELVDAGAGGIITDRPDRLLQLLGRAVSAR